MKHFFNKTFLFAAAIAVTSLPAAAQSSDGQPRFRHISKSTATDKTNEHIALLRDAVRSGQIQEDSLLIRSVEEILEETIIPADIPSFNRLNAPWVFAEYRALDKQRRISIPSLNSQMPQIWKLSESIRATGRR